jgi:hypothetical protein
LQASQPPRGAPSSNASWPSGGKGSSGSAAAKVRFSTNSPLREDLLDVEWFVAYLESEVEDLDALADATSGVPELAAVQSG